MVERQWWPQGKDRSIMERIVCEKKTPDVCFVMTVYWSLKTVPWFLGFALERFRDCRDNARTDNWRTRKSKLHSERTQVIQVVLSPSSRLQFCTCCTGSFLNKCLVRTKRAAGHTTRPCPGEPDESARARDKQNSVQQRPFDYLCTWG